MVLSWKGSAVMIKLYPPIFEMRKAVVQREDGY